MKGSLTTPIKYRSKYTLPPPWEMHCHHQKGENMDLCACMYKVDNPIKDPLLSFDDDDVNNCDEVDGNSFQLSNDVTQLEKHRKPRQEKRLKIDMLIWSLHQ